MTEWDNAGESGLKMKPGEILKAIRDGSPIDSDDVRPYFTQGKADDIRSWVRADDFNAVREFVYRHGTKDEQLFRLGVHCLQGIARSSRDDRETRARLRGFLEGLWMLPGLAPRQRISLIFGLLDHEDLDLAMHEKALGICVSEWDQFRTGQVSWAGGEGLVLAAVKERLADRGFPKTKRWIYLLALGACDASTKDAALAVLDSEDNTDNTLTRAAIAVARKSLERTLGINGCR